MKAKPNCNSELEKDSVTHNSKWPQCSSRKSLGITYKLFALVSWIKEPAAKGDDRGGWVLEKIFKVIKDSSIVFFLCDKFIDAFEQRVKMGIYNKL